MTPPANSCPQCQAVAVHFRAKLGDWTCLDCGHCWKPDSTTSSKAPAAPKARIFLSYGRQDAKDLADRLRADLEARGFEVWQDAQRIRSGKDWQQEIEDGLRSTQLVVAMLSPHAVRRADSADTPDRLDSACLDEISFARFGKPPKPIVPVMAVPCEPPLTIHRLDYVNLCAWRDSPDQYRQGLDRIVLGIEAALRGDPPRYRSWDDCLKPWDFAGFLYEKRKQFCGRAWLFDEIDAWRASRNERAILITGDPGTGKSAIVAELVHRNPGGQVLAYHCCQADTHETLQPARFVRSLAAMIASNFDAYAVKLAEPAIEEALNAEKCAGDPGSAFEAGILIPLQSLPAPAEGVRYLLIDALDEALALDGGGSSFNIVNLLATRLNRLPPWLRIVATTRKERAVLDRLRGLRAQEIDAQDPRNLEDVRHFIAGRLREPDVCERLAASGLQDRQVAQRLCEKSAGNFLYAVQVLDGIERDVYSFDNLDALPPGLSGLYQRFFERHFPSEASFGPVKTLLQVVLAAREPLTSKQLARITELHADEDLPRLLHRLGVYLPEATGKYAVYHKSLADWLTADERRGDLHFISLRPGHQRLADTCWQEYVKDVQTLSSYALKYLPEHLCGAEQWDRLERLLLDLTFLETKAEKGLVFDLAGDFTKAVRSFPHDLPMHRILKLLEEALRRDLHFIARHPTTLFQCLWNTCWWYDCWEAKDHYEIPEGGPWELPEPKLSSLLVAWRAAKERAKPGFMWLRSLRPPALHLGTAQTAVYRGHERRVNSVAISVDGQRIVSGSYDKTVRVWDAVRGVELRCLRGHEDLVFSVGISADGRQIVSGSEDNTVRVWDAISGVELRCLRGHEDRVNSVAISPDGRQIVSGSEDNTVRVWDAISGVELRCLRGHEDRVNSVAISPDGRQIVSGSLDNTMRVWDATSGVELRCLRGHEKKYFWNVTSVAISPDGRKIVSGSEDETVRVWDATSGVELRCLRGHEEHDVGTGVAISPDGRQIVSAAEDNTVRVWDSTSGDCLNVIQGKGDLAAIAAGDKRFPWRAVQRGIETVVESSHDARAVAWFPEHSQPTTLPSGRTWVMAGKYLCLFVLEGNSRE